MLILEPKNIKPATVSTFPSSLCIEMMGPMPWSLFFECWVLSQLFSCSSFTFIKRHFSPSSLSAIRVLSSSYLRLLIFLSAILIPAYDSSSLFFFFCEMYSVYKLNKWGHSVQPRCTPFPILNQSIVPSLVQTVASWPAYRFLRRHVRWSGILNSLRIFPQFFVIHTVKGFSVINEAEVNIFLELACLFYDPSHVGNLISYSSVFSKSSLSEVAQSCPTLWDPMDCSLPCPSICGILQARILEWVAISFSRRSSQPRDLTQVSRIAGRCFTIWATREAQIQLVHLEFLGSCTAGA